LTAQNNAEKKAPKKARNYATERDKPVRLAAMDELPATQPYRVLARKYRPRNFAELIGQDAMVRTLTNAITADRLPHAFILTGVRGVGKTSTARIIARALNCIGEDGAGGPTTAPCGVCEHCTAIAQDRHVDVIEMDAASRTGVGDIRELIDGVRYRPVNARYKIYIIDEVHMLSTSAFNALLKTLEEPPEHVKFIFATTETRKVPVTVLSRCQRFDLRRVDTETLVSHFSDVAEKESASVTDGALGLIARAADGSVRDGLSLLDQAIAHGNGDVSDTIVREMLGLADGGRIYDLYEAAMKGAVTDALDVFTELYNSGADPVVILQDLLQVTHWLTRVKLSPATVEQPGVPELDRTRGTALATSLDIPVLGRTWQLLLKGMDEVRTSSSAAQAAEMVLIRWSYMADLPSPADLIKKLQAGDGAVTSPATNAPVKQTTPASGPASSVSDPTPVSGPTPGGDIASPSGFGTDGPSGGGATVTARVTNNAVTAEAMPEQPPDLETNPENPIPDPVPSNTPATYEAIVDLFAERREGILHAALSSQVHLVRFEPGHISIRAREEAPSDLATQVSRLLTEWTGMQWLVSLSTEEGDPTLREQREAHEANRLGVAISHPMVQAALSAFPGATVEAVHDREIEFLESIVDPDSGEDDDEQESIL
jgi:DNA polymerase-3 subunit gamma/tau